MVGPRSYDVKVGERHYRRNRRQLIHAGEPPLQEPSKDPPFQDLPHTSFTDSQTMHQPNVTPAGTEVPPSVPDTPGLRRSS